MFFTARSRIGSITHMAHSGCASRRSITSRRVRASRSANRTARTEIEADLGGYASGQALSRAAESEPAPNYAIHCYVIDEGMTLEILARSQLWTDIFHASTELLECVLIQFEEVERKSRRSELFGKALHCRVLKNLPHRWVCHI